MAMAMANPRFSAERDKDFMTPNISDSPNRAATDTKAPVQPAYWSGVFAMTLCVFALIASEFMPVSLLTPLAADLHVSEGMAGQGIAISGAFAVLTSLSIATIARKMNRKTLLLALTGLMCLSGAIVGMAPNYATYMAGRALIGVVVGGFWSMMAFLGVLTIGFVYEWRKGALEWD